MGILSWVVLGLIAGLAARAIMPGADPGGIVVTIVLGMVGAVIAGFIAATLGFGGVTGVNLASVIAAVAGAVAVLAVYRLLVMRRAATWD